MAKNKDVKIDDSYDFDQGFSDDDFNFDFESLDPDNDRDASTFTKARRWTKEAIADELKSPERQVRLIKNSLPKSYNTAIDAAQGTFDSAVSLYNDARDEFDKTAPAIRRQLKGHAELLRKVRLGKLADWAEQNEETSSYQTTDYDEQNIKDQLDSVFSNAIAQGLVKAKEAEEQAGAEAQEEKEAEEALSRKRSEGYQRQSIAQGQAQGSYLRSMARDIRRQADYQDQITANVQRKSLEVQLRSFVLQQNFNQRFVQHSMETVGELKAITKNTGLPDYVKINSQEMMMETAQRRMYSKIGGYFDGNIRQIANKVQAKLAGKIREVGGSIRQAADGGNQLSGTGLPGGQIASMLITSTLMDEGQRLLEPHLRKQLAKIPGLDAMGQSSDAILKNLGRLVSENKAGGTGYRALDKAVDFFELKRNPHQTAFSLKQSEQAELDQATSLDNRAKRSITEVIPEWLSRIHNELRVTRTGDTTLEADRWDWQSGRITKADELRSRTERKLKSANNRAARNYNAAVDGFMRHLDPDDTFTSQQHEFVRKWYFERIKSNRSTIILELFREKIPDNVDAADLREKIKVNTGLTEGDFQAYGSGSLKTYINMSKGASRKANNWLARETKYREDATRFMPMDMAAIQDSIKQGYGREAIELGYARIDPETGALELDPAMLQRAAMSQGRVEYKQSGEIYKNAKGVTKVKRNRQGAGWEAARYSLDEKQRAEQIRIQRATEAAYRQYHKANATHSLFTDTDEYLDAAERQRRKENDEILKTAPHGVPRFAGGGYTGDHAPHKPVGVVDGKEFVVGNKGTKANRNILEAVNKLGAPLFNKDGTVNKVYHEIVGHDKVKKASINTASFIERLTRLGIDADDLTDEELEALTNPLLKSRDRIKASGNARVRLTKDRIKRTSDRIKSDQRFINAKEATNKRISSLRDKATKAFKEHGNTKTVGKVYDIFIQKSKDAILTAEGFAKGWYYDENTGKILKSPDGITGNVLDQNGELLVGASDLLKGTWDKVGKKLRLPSLNKDVLNGRSIAQMSSEIKARVQGSASVRGVRIFKNKTLNALMRDTPVDVFVFGRDVPALTAVGFQNGDYFDRDSGEVLWTHHDIRGIVVDKSGQTLLDLKQLHDGLYDNAGNPLPISQLKQIRNLLMRRGSALYKKHLAPHIRKFGDKLMQSHERRLMGKEAIDVWKLNETKPRIYATGFDAGVVTDTESGEVLKNHLMIKGGVSVAGKPVLHLEEVLDGLYNEDGEKLELPRMKSFSARLLDHAGRAVMGTKTYAKFRNWLSGKPKNEKVNTSFDVYIAGEIKPLLFKAQFDNGEYFCKGQDGPIYFPSEITGSIYDRSGNVIVTEDKLVDLVDVRGKPVVIGMKRNIDDWRSKHAGNNVILKGINKLKARRREAMTDLFEKSTGKLKLKGLDLNQGKLFRADNNKPIENYGDIAAGVVDANGQSVISTDELAQLELCDSAGKTIISKGNVSGKGSFVRKLKSMFGLREGSWQWKRKKKEEAEKNKSKDVNIKIDGPKEKKQGWISKILGGFSGVIGTLATTMFAKFGGWFGKLRNAIILQKLAGGFSSLAGGGKGKFGLAMKVAAAGLTAYAGYKMVNSMGDNVLGDFFGGMMGRDEMDAVPMPGASKAPSSTASSSTLPGTIPTGSEPVDSTGNKFGDAGIGGAIGEIGAMAAMGGTVYGINKWRKKRGMEALDHKHNEPKPTTRKGKVIHALTKNPYGRIGVAGLTGAGAVAALNYFGSGDPEDEGKGIAQLTGESALGSYATEAGLMFGLPWLKKQYDKRKAAAGAAKAAKAATAASAVANASRAERFGNALDTASTVADVADVANTARRARIAARAARAGRAVQAAKGVGDVASTAAKTVGKRGLLMRGAGALGRGALAVGKGVMKINPMAIAKVALNVGRFMLGPVGLAIGAAALVGYLGYKFYKSRKARKIPFVHFRMAQYGFEMGSKESEKLLELEGLLANHTTWSDKSPSIKQSLPIPDVLKIFGIEDPQAEESKEHLPRFLIWFQHRFKPIYLSYIKQTAKLGFNDFAKLETNVGSLDQMRVIKDVHFTNPGGQNPYMQTSSPFKEPLQCTEDIDDVQKKMKWAMDCIGSNENKNANKLDLKKDEGLGKIDKPKLDEKVKPAKNSINATAQNGSEVKGNGLASDISPSGKSVSPVEESVKGMRDMGKISKALSQETNDGILKTQEEANKNMESLWEKTWSRVKDLATKAMNFVPNTIQNAADVAGGIVNHVGASLSGAWDAVTGGSKAKQAEANLIRAAQANGITDPKEIAMFLAQCAHESGGFVHSEEIATGAAYEGRKDLGNTQPGDGKRFKGRGYLQVTGRANYAAFAKRSGIDVVSNPDIIAKDPKMAAMASVDWWVNNSRARAAGQKGDIMAASRAVNGTKVNGLDDRKQRWGYYSQAIGNDVNAYVAKLGVDADGATPANTPAAKADGSKGAGAGVLAPTAAANNPSHAPASVKAQASAMLNGGKANVTNNAKGGLPATIARPANPGTTAVPKADASKAVPKGPAAKKPYFIGDSIADGYKRAMGGEGWTKVGINPKTVLMYLSNSILKTPSEYRGRKIYVSTGMSNDCSDITTIAEQLRRLKVHGVKVNVLGVSNQYPHANPAKLNAILQHLCKTYGMTFMGGFNAGKDKVHPASYSSFGGASSTAVPKTPAKSTTKSADNSVKTGKGTAPATAKATSKAEAAPATPSEVKEQATAQANSPQGNSNMNAKAFAQSMDPSLVSLGRDSCKVADSNVDLKGMNQDFMTIFYAMVGEWKRSGGKGYAQINSAYRSVEKQKAMYQAYLARGKKAPAVAKPGRSRHNSGVALDVNSNNTNQFHSMGLLTKYKFHRPVRNEAWHLENTLFSKGQDTQRGIDQDTAQPPTGGSSSGVGVMGSSGGSYGSSSGSSYGASTQQEYGSSGTGTSDVQVIQTLTQQLAVQKEILKELKTLTNGKSTDADKKATKENIVPDQKDPTAQVNQMLGNVLNGLINRLPGGKDTNKSGQPLSQQFPVSVQK